MLNVTKGDGSKSRKEASKLVEKMSEGTVTFGKIQIKEES